MAKGSTKGSKKDKEEKDALKKQTNTYDVLIRLIDRTYDILNSGNIIGIIAVIVLLVIWRLPPEQLGKQVETAMNMFTHERFYFVPLLGSLVFSIGINFYQRKIYKLEIKRLA
jgi:hypothetical protein